MQCCHHDCLAAFHPYCAHSSGVFMAVNVDSLNQAHYEIFCRKHDPNRRRASRNAQVGAERDRKASKGSVESYRHRHRNSAETWNVEGYSEEEEEEQRRPDTPLVLLTNSPDDGLQDTAQKNIQLRLLKTRKR